VSIEEQKGMLTCTLRASSKHIIEQPVTVHEPINNDEFQLRISEFTYGLKRCGCMVA